MGPSGPRSELINLVGIGYKGRISSKFTFVYKTILVIMQGCIGVSKQSLWIGLIDYLVNPIGLLINQNPFWVRLSDLNPCGLKSLKPNQESYKYPVGVKVSITFVFHHLERLRVITSTLFSFPSKVCQDQGSSYWAEDFGFTRLPRFRSSFLPCRFDSGTSKSKVWFLLALSKFF